MEILGIKLNGTEARKAKETAVSGVDVNINIDNVTLRKDEIRIAFTYSANYVPEVGFLRIYGMVFGKESGDKAKRIMKEWEKSKSLPPEIAEVVLNLINVSAGVNGVLVARSINLLPPLVPPRIAVKK